MLTISHGERGKITPMIANGMAVHRAAKNIRLPSKQDWRRAMSIKSTPGPWDYFIGNSDGRGLIRIEVSGTANENCGQHIASMPRGNQSEANARLIAAAPELLAAAKALCLAYGGSNRIGRYESKSILAARAAIAKAEGRTP